MIGKKINQLATELAPVSTDLTIIGDPISGVSKKITLAQLGAIFSGAVSFYTNLAAFPAVGDINVIYCAKDTQKLYLWSGSAYVEVFPSQALLDTYQLRSEKGVSNGYASLDSGGKVPISQLPSSIMEYKGMWNAATNTPTLANGTGDTGDVYICNVAGTVNFGAGPITFAVGDYVIYSGSIWQRSSGAVGTVTSVGLTITGDAVGVTGSPITTSGTLALAFGGTNLQYINGAGNLTTFPILTGFVPYTGATANVDLGTFDLTADVITGATGSYTSSGGGNTLNVTHSSGSGIALNITKGGNGEALNINKTSGSGNAVTIIGTLNATTLVKSGGTSSQFLKADGSVDSNTYLTTSAAASTYLPMVLSSTANFVDINGQQFSIYGSAGNFTSGRIIVDPVFSALGYQNAGVFNGLKILTNGSAEFSNSGITRFFNQVRFDSTLSNGTHTYTLPSATGTLALTSQLTGGTVTSVGLSSATSGVTIGSTPITTSGTITLAIATASGSQQGLLSSTDWTTFNNKQSALTNPVTGSGTTNFLPKFTGASTIGNSIVQDSGGVLSVAGRLSASGNDFHSLIVAEGSAQLKLERTATSTGLMYLGADNVGFKIFDSAFATRLTLTSSGNLGLGVTPSAWNSVLTSLDIKGGLSIMGFGNESNYLNNTYYDTGYKYKANGFAGFYAQTDTGQHRFYVAPSGTAGNAISFTQAMTLDASGNLSIGQTSSALQSGGTGITVFGSSASEIKFLNSTTGALTTDGTALVTSGLNFTINNREAGDLIFGTSNTTRLTIASTGAATFSDIVNARNLRVFKSSFRGGLFAYNDISGTGDDHSITVFAESGTNNGNIYFCPNGSATRVMTINTSSNVGIGTINPAVNLDVRSASVSAPSFIATGNSDISKFISIYGGTSVDAVSAIWWKNGQSLKLATATSNNGASESIKMLITDGGNVGIGTTSPVNAKVEVFTNSAVSYNPAIFNNVNLALRSGGSPTTGTIVGITMGLGGSAETMIGAVQNASGTGDIVFQTYNGSAYGERMRIKSNGIVNFSNVPSSSAGLSSGDIYKTVAGVLMIV